MKGASPSFDNLSNNGGRSFFAFSSCGLFLLKVCVDPDLTICRAAVNLPFCRLALAVCGYGGVQPERIREAEAGPGIAGNAFRILSSKNELYLAFRGDHAYNFRRTVCLDEMDRSDFISSEMPEEKNNEKSKNYQKKRDTAAPVQNSGALPDCSCFVYGDPDFQPGR